jgi:nucleoside phosphorylase
MPSEACVGRVAGLAVALGVGAAVVTGWNSGLAWADESGATNEPATSSTEPATKKPDATSVEAASPDVRTTPGSLTKDVSVRSAQPGVVGGTGGLTDDASAPTTTTPQPSETAEAPGKATEEGPTSKPAAKKKSDPATANPTKVKTPAPPPSYTDATHDATEPTTETHTDTTAAVSTEQPGTALRAFASTQASTVTESLAVSTPKPLQPNVVSVVSKLVSGVVNAILSPFAASNAPGAPEAPSIWTLLAFVRREFENAFASPSLNETPVDTPTTSQTEPEQRTLILTAFPAEADAILARTTLDPNATVVVDGHHFYLGTLGGKKVIVAMTGIGMVNATQTTETALDYFTPEYGISIGAVVFSGVAGGSGRTEIGSVAVPARWTSDEGATWHPVDPDMLAAANTLDVDMLSSDSVADPSCYCGLFGGFPRIDLGREPQLFVGGDGSSDDNNGTAFPAIPLGGDIFGPQPCAAPDFSPLFTGNFFQAVVPFLAFGLVTNITGFLTDVPLAVDAVDQETAAAQQVADAHGIPFLGIRGMSDGPGDPLNLPGYPFSFFVYKQIAADNAAIVTEAFLTSWEGP